CAQLLDLPSDPQLAEESAPTAADGEPASGPGSVEPGAEPPESGDGATSPTGDVTPGPRAPSPTNGGSSDERAGLDAETADAGLPAVDAATPVDVPPNDPCDAPA